MDIAAIQALITKYGPNFGIPAKTPDPTAKNPTTPPVTPAAGAAGVRTADHVTLSPQALEYQAAHTSPTGKFQKPNLFGDLMTALDPTPDASGDATQNSLLDILNSKATDGSSTQDPASSTDPTKPFDSLSSFLG